MATAAKATINLQTPYELRNRVLGKLRMRGTTMRDFFVDLMEMIDADAEFLEMLESKRHAFRGHRSLVQKEIADDVIVVAGDH